MRNIWFLFILIAAVSCDPGRIYEENQEFDNGIWVKDSIPSFLFTIPQEGRYNVYMNVRNTLEYPYQNLYVTYYLEDTLGNSINSELVNFSLFESKSGIPYGEGGIGDIYGHQFNLLNDYEFKPKTYRLRLKHYMRTDSLNNILAVGIRVENNKVVE